MGWKIKIIVTAIYCISSLPVFSQRGKPIVTIDFVKIKDGKTAEAMFFYENNWKVFRLEALKKGFIKSFKMMSSETDTLGGFNIILLTEYKDSLQYNSREQNFGLIMKQNSPNGPKLLNGLKPRDFTTIVFSKNAVLEYGN